MRIQYAPSTGSSVNPPARAPNTGKNGEKKNRPIWLPIYVRGVRAADIILVDIKAPDLTPNLDTVATLIHYGNDVDTAIVDSRVLMKEKKIQSLDMEKVLLNSQVASEEVWRGFKEEYPQFPEVAKRFKYFQ